MARDYKQSRSAPKRRSQPRKTKRGESRGPLKGFAAGLVLGLSVALATHLYHSFVSPRIEHIDAHALEDSFLERGFDHVSFLVFMEPEAALFVFLGDQFAFEGADADTE